MCVTPVQLDAAKWMLKYRLPSFKIMCVLFDIVIIDVHRILVFASVYNAFRLFGALMF